MTGDALLVRGARVYDHDGDTEQPPVADVLVAGGRIEALGAGLPVPPQAEVLDGSDRLLLPGLVNAHYHSHDVLCRGLFEELPLDMWLLYSSAMGAARSVEELRVRTLLGAVENLRAGVTTVQDMVALAPCDEASVQVVADAYAEAGIRCVLSLSIQDVPTVESVPWLAEVLPPALRGLAGDTAVPAAEQLAVVRHSLAVHASRRGLHWALAPVAPQRSSDALLDGVATLAREHDLPVITHVYETRGQAVQARARGRLLDRLDHAGLLDRRLSIAHGVWTAPAELERLAERDAGMLVNAMSNLKLKSGVAPVRLLHDLGVRTALGSDNCSGSDVQSPWLGMRLWAGFMAASDPEPGPPRAAEALRMATLGGARALGLAGEVGAVKPGMRADFVLLDLDDPAWRPLNGAARQLVWSETGRAVTDVVVDGRVVLRDRRPTGVDEAALRASLEALMPGFRRDLARVRDERAPLLPWYREAHRRAWRAPLGFDRFLPRG